MARPFDRTLEITATEMKAITGFSHGRLTRLRRIGLIPSVSYGQSRLATLRSDFETYWAKELMRRETERVPREQTAPKERAGRAPKVAKPVVAKMSPSEAGRLGGIKLLQKYGRQHHVETGRMGGIKIRETRGSSFFAEIGKKGGNSLKASRDPDYYSTIGKMRGKNKAARDARPEKT